MIFDDSQMRGSFYVKFLLFLYTVFVLMAYLAFVSYAQIATNITSDNSLGTQVTPNGNMYDITGGTRPEGGPNLFHSFGQFSVGGGDTANFLNDTGAATSNILSRVTGGDPSNIYGTIQTTDFPGANLFLLNPAGVLFGPSARLNVSGSFYASTADFLRLGEDGIFYAELGEESVLTITNPTAFGFLGDNPAGIALDQSQLTVAADHTLSLVGGDVDISGAQLTAPNGNIVLASVASPGEVTGIGRTDIQVDAPELGSIGISDQALLKTDGPGGGSVIIRGGNLRMVDSQITANSTGPENGLSGNGPGEGIDIEVTGDLFLDTGSIIETNVGEEAPPGVGSGPIRIRATHFEMRGDPEDSGRTRIRTGFGPDLINSEGGKAGDIEVTATSVRLKHGNISTEACCSLEGGNIVMNVQQSLGLDETTILSRSILPTGGKAGYIDIDVQNGPVSLINQSSITTNSGAGGGNINVVVGKEIYSNGAMTFEGGDILLDDSSIFSLLALTGEQGGDVQIIGRNLDIRNGSSLSVESIFVPVSDEPSGALTINLTGNLTMRGKDTSGNPNQITVIARGGKPSGGLTITAKDVVIGDSGFVGTETQDSGRGGNLTINADNLLVTDESILSSSSRRGFFSGDSFGDAGDITLELSGNVVVSRGGRILATTSEEGNGGSITIVASSLFQTDEGSITAETSSTGNAGSVIVKVNNLTTDTGAEISSSSSSDASDAGDAGSIQLTATNSIDLSATSITTSAVQGRGGNIAITAGQNLQLMNESTVLAESSGVGNSGGVTLTATNGNFQIDNSEVSTSAQQARGGAIAISAGQTVQLMNNSTVLAESFGPGKSGTVTLTAGSGNFQIDSSEVSTQAKQAEGGDVAITAGQDIGLTNQAFVSTQSFGQGNAGDVALTSGHDITMTDSTISTEAAQASGGNIELTAPNIIQLTNSLIQSSVLGGQATRGGDITLDPMFIILQSSQILAKAVEGNGGNISLTATEGVFISSDSVLDASSEKGISGIVSVSSPVSALAEVVAALPKNFAVLQSLYADACAAQAGGQYSSFTQGAPAAIPPGPGGFLSSPLLLNHLTTPPSTGSVSQPSPLMQSRLGLDFSPISLLPAYGCAG